MQSFDDGQDDTGRTSAHTRSGQRAAFDKRTLQPWGAGCRQEVSTQPIFWIYAKFACRTRTIASRSSCLSVSQYPTSRIRTAHSASSTAQSRSSAAATAASAAAAAAAAAAPGLDEGD